MIILLIGIISGIVSGSGMGGGTVLILCLSVFLGIEQHTAQGANLIYFIPTSISAIITNIKQKIINWKLGIPIVFFGIIGAIIGANIAIKLNVIILKKFFGIFLFFIAFFQIYELFIEYKRKRKTQNKIRN